MSLPTKRLTEKESRFVAALLGDAAGNGTKAAVLAGYGKSGAKVIASRLLKKPKIQAALANLRDKQVDKTLTTIEIVRERTMSGDEAMERLTTFARADIGNLLEDGDPIKALPPDVRQTIKAIRPTRYGRVLELHDAMKATELIAKSAGKLKEIVQVESLETLIAKSMEPKQGAAA